MPTHGGGKPVKHDLDYATPQGPKGQFHNSVGLGGANSGVTNQPTSKDGASGSPGIGGTNHGCGTQGRH